MSHPDPRPLQARAPGSPLAGRLGVPGDKSISHRALMFGALAVGTTEISGLLEGEDVLRTAAAMRALGAEVERVGPGAWRVSGRGVGGLVEPADVLDMGNSGTAARLLLGLLAGHPVFATMTGDASLRKRPMKRVTEPLSATGAAFWTREGGRLPLAIRGAADPLPIDYTLPVASAQVKSACLLAGLCAPGTTRVVEREPTRDHTENMLRHFGATVSVEDTAQGRLVTLEGQPELVAAPVLVPGDPSSAAFPIVSALLVPGSRVVVENIGLNPLRTGLITTLREMGAALRVENERVAGGEPVGDLVAEYTELTGVTVPPGRAPSMIDEYPVLAVAAAAARGVTRMTGLAELRVKESDRLAATFALLAANGVKATIEGDDLIVEGTAGAIPGGGTVETHMDHRIAMSALVMGLAARAPVTADDAAFIDTSFPGFATLMNGLAGTEAMAAP
ncbi:3-phosphoshikimate 1-carboxyvinyltransferase [Roseomonas terrae]|jgi:3-phosphoshikimate 1-carboxyvinyltransferase|uniref:3-phosphoshikimate 1-carboxyvinyltransferase n=1 Tax=Neoroseomonas terrae TaxID=424799 RepID=A0ABS5ENT3_9PROT|nr:3-phosphoshikimate 1-carboxyvinyltransferase [Neoroseomonas terrae]MBR0652610.1 3-phosphoshikimate 1-carboxyvinyltransferase [Neoroseomonas terrae]